MGKHRRYDLLKLTREKYALLLSRKFLEDYKQLSFKPNLYNIKQKDKVNDSKAQIRKDYLKCTYLKIQKRKELIDLVDNKKMSIAKAGRKLHIKASTAKLIVKKYRETGLFTTKRRDIELFEESESSESSDHSENSQIRVEIESKSSNYPMEPQPMFNYNIWVPNSL